MIENRYKEISRGETHWDEPINENIQKLNEDLRTGGELIVINNKMKPSMVLEDLNKPVIPDVTIMGRTLINLVGRAGSSVHQMYHWYTLTNCTFSTELLNNVPYFCVNITNQNLKATIGLNDESAISGLLKKDHLYISAVEVDTGIADFVSISMLGGITRKEGKIKLINNRSLVYCVSSAGDANNIIINIKQGITEKKFNMDLIRVYEITQEEFNLILTDDTIIPSKYHYVDDIKPIVNPYIKSVENILHDHIYIHGNTDTKFNLYDNEESPLVVSRYRFKLEKNSTYTLSSEGNSSDEIVTIASIKNGVQTNFDGTFNTQDFEEFIVVVFDGANKTPQGAKNVLEKLQSGEIKITLVKGDSAKKHDECVDSMLSFQTTLYDGEKIFKNDKGEYIKESCYEELTDFDKMDFMIGSPRSGHKHVLAKYKVHDISILSESHVKGIRYDGMILPYDGVAGLKNSVILYSVRQSTYPGYISICIPNELSGWGDDYTPTTDEIRAFFLGWRMYGADKINGETDIDLWNGNASEETHNKEWLKIWCGIGDKKTDYLSIPFIIGSNVYKCPTTMNDKGFIPYKIVCRKQNPTYEKIQPVGSLSVSKDTEVTFGSGVVIDEKHIITYMNDDKGYFNDVHGKINNNKSSEILLLLKNGKRIDCAIHYFTVIESMLCGGILQAGSKDLHYGDIVLASYKKLDSETVGLFDVSLKYKKGLCHILNDTKEILSAMNHELYLKEKELEMVKYELSQRSNPNLLINGDFRINQRGKTEYRHQSGYTVDRWLSIGSKVNSIGVVVNDGYITLDTTNNAEKSQAYIIQRIDPFILTKLLNKKVSVSIRYKSSINFRLQFGDNGYMNCKASGSWTEASFSAKMNNINQYTGGLIIQAYDSAELKFTVGKIDIEWVKLELGEFATPFVPRSYQEELSDCQRYYQKIEGMYVPDIMTNDYVRKTFSNIMMRTTPSMHFGSDNFNKDYGIRVTNNRGDTIDGFTFSFITDSEYHNNTISIMCTKKNHNLERNDCLILIEKENCIVFDAEIY